MKAFYVAAVAFVASATAQGFYPTDCTALRSQCQSTGDPNESYCAALYASCTTCETTENSCRTGPNANQAQCSADRAACDGQTNSTYPITSASSASKTASSTSKSSAPTTSSVASGFYPTDCTALRSQCQSTGDPNESYCAALYYACNDCSTTESSCRTAPQANQALCSANRASCDAKVISTYPITTMSSVQVTSTTTKHNMTYSVPHASTSVTFYTTVKGTTTKATSAPVTNTPIPPTAQPSQKTVTVTVTSALTECTCPSSSTHAASTLKSSPATSTKTSPSSTTSSTPKTSGTTTSKSCPANLSGSWEYPHLIVPVSKASPSKTFGTSYNGLITPSDMSSIFNFDVPNSDAGKTCSLIFLLPEPSQLETSSYTFSGDGKIDFKSLKAPAVDSTTFANQPAVTSDLETLTVAPGGSYVVSSFACPAGQRVGFELSSESTSLDFFQDYNPSPIGLYITVC